MTILSLTIKGFSDSLLSALCRQQILRSVIFKREPISGTPFDWIMAPCAVWKFWAVWSFVIIDWAVLSLMAVSVKGIVKSDGTPRHSVLFYEFEPTKSSPLMIFFSSNSQTVSLYIPP